jgi:hypothetical protein
MFLTRSRIAASALVASTIGLVGAPVYAAPKNAKNAQCFDAYEAAQRARKKGQLRETQKQLASCAAAQCPPFIAKDCTQWASEVEQAMPTVVFVARDGTGADVVDVRVAVDGAEVRLRLDGAPMPLDPGPHRVKFTRGEETVETSVVLVEGERNRRVEGAFAPPPGTASAAAPSDAPRASGGIPTASWILGGVAVAGGVSFAVFALLGKKQQACAPHCSRAEVNAMRRDYAIADASWITGVAAAAGAVLVWALRPSASGPAAGVTVAPVAGGASLDAHVRF